MKIISDISVNSCKCKKHDILTIFSHQQNIKDIISINNCKVLKIWVKNNTIKANIPLNSMPRGKQFSAELDLQFRQRESFRIQPERSHPIYANVQSGYSAKSFPNQIVQLNPWGRMQTTPMVGRAFLPTQ